MNNLSAQCLALPVKVLPPIQCLMDYSRWNRVPMLYFFFFFTLFIFSMIMMMMVTIMMMIARYVTRLRMLQSRS